MFSPIRVNTDALRLLHMAWTKVETGTLAPDQFPPAYPSIVSFLIQLGFDHAFWLVLLNYASLALGLLTWAVVAIRAMNWPPSAVRIGAILFLSSWVVVKHAPIPLTEPLYFALANLSLYAAVRARDASASRPLLWWLLAFAIAALATMTRSIGVSLLVAVIVAASLHLLAALKRHTQERPPPFSPRLRNLMLTAAALLSTLLLIAITRIQLSHPESYLDNWIAIASRTSLTDIIGLWSLRLMELGALTINLPLRSDGSLSLAVRVLGALFTALLLVQLWKQRSRSVVINAYVAFYSAILAIWPYEDPRFWYPLLPWMILVCAPGPTVPTKNSRVLFGKQLAYGAYVAFGLVALGYSTRLTFAGDDFPQRYTHGALRASYEAAFGLAAPSTSEAADPRTTTILRRYAPATPLSDDRQ